MDKARNFLELKEELEMLQFPVREIIHAVRQAIYDNAIYRAVPCEYEKSSLTLNFGRDEFGKLGLYDHQVQYNDAINRKRLQIFENDVPLSDALRLMESRTKYYDKDPEDAAIPLYLSDVKREQAALDQRQINGPGVFEGVNVAALEKRMQAVDWQQHPGYWLGGENELIDPRLVEMRNVENLVFRLDISADREALQIGRELMLKHFTGTPLEKPVREDIPGMEMAIKTYKIQNDQEQLIINVMNTQNSEFLKKTLLNLGFGEGLNADLEKQIAARSPEFNLQARHEFNQKAIDYTLHFKAGKEQEMYFFNKYDASIPHQNDPAKDLNQTFFINKGSGITAKEAFNLMEGRSVHKQLYNAEGQKYQSWLTLDDKNLTDNGNKKIKHYHENYGYDVEKVIEGKGIKEMDDPKAKDDLLRSLKKGNAQQITVGSEGGDKKFFIAANPKYKTIDLYDHQMKKIKREELLGTSAKATKSLKSSAQSQEGLSPKNQSRKSKMSV